MLINHNTQMFEHRNQTLVRFGLDQTGSVGYNFNSQGFRGSYEFDFMPDHAFFGCSLVFGIGVPEEKTFAYLFDRSHNYGLAGTYNNTEIMRSLQDFIESDLYSPRVKMVVVWHRRNDEKLLEFYDNLRSYTNLLHFFCGQELPHQRCFKCVSNFDLDVSGTHMGAKTHQIFYATISDRFGHIVRDEV